MVEARTAFLAAIAQREQLRDWIWNVTLARRATLTSIPDVFTGVADQSLLRDNALAALYQPSGPTRSVATTAGKVIVLVEAMSEPTLWANALEAIDAQSLALGRMPELVEVFAYELSPTRAEARVCKVRELNPMSLESAEHGFRRATLSTYEDLEHFLADGVDLLSAQCTREGLRVAGRQRPRTLQARVEAEHVAAFAQKPGTRYIPPELFGQARASLAPEMRRAIEDSARKLEVALTRESQGRLDTSDELLATVRSWRKANPGAEVADLLLSYQLQRRTADEPAFSLDPSVSSAEAIKNLNALLAGAADASGLSGVLRAWGSEELAAMADHLPASVLSEIKRGLLDARQDLLGPEGHNAEAILLAPPVRGDITGGLTMDLLFQIYTRSTKQCARYEGALAGTSTGMTLFYTDLAAKFFARRWPDVSPEVEIDGFRSIVDHLGTTAWCQEQRKRTTRVWFGLRDDAYRRESADALRFAPTATRLFARGSDFGFEAESEPAPVYRRLNEWWTRNYPRVASWDAQYEALNQLLKWSTVVLNARMSGNASCMAPLTAAKVRTDWSLKSWAAGQAGLRWRNNVLQVMPASAGRECLPVIESQLFHECGTVMRLAGGVVAGSLRELRSKQVRRQAPPPGLGRLAGDTLPIAVEAQRVSFKHLRGWAGAGLENASVTTAPGRVQFDALLPDGAAQTGNLGSFSKSFPVKQARQVVEGNEKALSIEQVWNGLPTLRLQVSDLDQDTVHVVAAAGVLEQARSMARNLALDVARDSRSLDAAARALGIAHRVLAGDRIALALGPASSPTFVLLESATADTAAPQGTRLGAVVGALDGGLHGRGEGYAPPVRSVALWVLEQDAAKQLLAGAMLVPGHATDPHEPAQEFKLALEARNLEQAAQIAKQVTGDGMTGQALFEMHSVLSAQRVQLERAGAATQGLDNLALQLELAAAKSRPASANDLAIRGEKVKTVVALPSFPATSELPPALHQAGPELAPNQHFVSRAIDLPGPFADGTRVRTLTGETYELRAVADSQPTGDWHGSALRLATRTRPALVIIPCSDTDPSAPPCRKRFSDESRQLALQQVTEEMCYPDEDSSWRVRDAAACVKAIAACDRMAQGNWTSAQARNCARTALVRYGSPRAPR